MKRVLAMLVCTWGTMALVARAAETAPAPGAEKAPPAAATAADAQSEDQKIAYTIGFLNGTNALRYRFRPDEWEAFRKGLEDAVAKRASITDADDWRPKIQKFVMARDAEAAVENKKAGQEFLAKAAAEAGATKTASGLVMKTTKPGTGPSPADADQVKVKYRGMLADGTVFDDSEKHGGSVPLGVGAVIPCWTEALKLMKVGEVAELYCPAEIAYGDRGAPPKIPGGATLHFSVELLEIVPRAAAPPAPAAPKPDP